MRMIAGCDGGGTKCEVQVVVLDACNRVVAAAQSSSGPANVSTDPDRAATNIVEATQDAIQLLGTDSIQTIDVLVAGLAGAGSPELRSEWSKRLSNLLPVGTVCVFADAALLFAAAEFTQHALATVIGTGSIAWSRRQDGTLDRAGGLGPEIGDEGSAYWIGIQAIEAAIQTWGKTDFTQAIASSMPSQFSEQISQFTHSAGTSLQRETIALMGQGPVAALSPIVFQYSDVDEIAARIVHRASEHIVELVIQAAGRLPNGPSAPIPWVCAGGVAVNQVGWLANIQSRCRQKKVYLSQPVLVERPVMGAVAIARSN